MFQKSLSKYYFLFIQNIFLSLLVFICWEDRMTEIIPMRVHPPGATRAVAGMDRSQEHLSPLPLPPKMHKVTRLEPDTEIQMSQAQCPPPKNTFKVEFTCD